jgi:hypothetical protein
MLSQKNQALDSWILLQIPQVHPTFEFGDSPKIETVPIRAISITYLKLTYLCDLGKLYFFRYDDTGTIKQQRFNKASEHA